MEARIIDGKMIAGRIKENLSKEIQELRDNGVEAKLVAVQAGENPASAVYVKQQKKSCENAGISYQLRELPGDVAEADLIESIEALNRDETVTGIILQLPVPEGIDLGRLRSSIDPSKDVEGVTPENMGMIVYGKPRLIPCTALAVKEIIESTGVDLYGKEAVMVGHSDIVGKPVSLLLVDKFATVSMCHVGTSKAGMLEQHVKRADILIVAVGKANLIPGSWVKKGAIVVDVGINRVEGKIVGDVDFESAAENAGFITPVPGGVGPVTTAILLRNVVEAAKCRIRVNS